MDTTVTLWSAIDGNVLEIDNPIILSTMTIEDDGVFETENDWKDFLSKVDSGGSYYLAENWTYNENGTHKVNGNKVTFYFNSPILVQTGYKIVNGNKEPVISEISEMKVEVDYEWSYLRSYDYLNCATMIDITGIVLDIK